MRRTISPLFACANNVRNTPKDPLLVYLWFPKTLSFSERHPVLDLFSSKKDKPSLYSEGWWVETLKPTTAPYGHVAFYSKNLGYISCRHSYKTGVHFTSLSIDRELYASAKVFRYTHLNEEKIKEALLFFVPLTLEFRKMPASIIKYIHLKRPFPVETTLSKRVLQDMQIRATHPLIPIEQRRGELLANINALPYYFLHLAGMKKMLSFSEMIMSPPLPLPVFLLTLAFEANRPTESYEFSKVDSSALRRGMIISERDGRLFKITSSDGNNGVYVAQKVTPESFAPPPASEAATRGYPIDFNYSVYAYKRSPARGF